MESQEKEIKLNRELSPRFHCAGNRCDNWCKIVTPEKILICKPGKVKSAKDIPGPYKKFDFEVFEGDIIFTGQKVKYGWEFVGYVTSDIPVEDNKYEAQLIKIATDRFAKSTISKQYPDLRFGAGPHAAMLRGAIYITRRHAEGASYMDAAFELIEGEMYSRY